MTSQIQGRREILYFWLKSHVIFISVTLQCSRWLMCLVIALFLCRKSLPLSVVSGSIQVAVVRVLRLVVFFFVCFFSMRPRSQWEGKPTSVRCRTVSQPPSRTYLLPKILSSITTDKSRLSAQFFEGNFCFDVYAVVPDHSLASHSAHWPTVWCLYLDAWTGRTYQKPEEKAKSWWTELTSLSLRYIDFYLFTLFSFFFLSIFWFGKNNK